MVGYGSVNEMSADWLLPGKKSNFTERDVGELTMQILNRRNDSGVQSFVKGLSNWQKTQLNDLAEQEMGVHCLLKGWFVVEPKLEIDKYCHTAWDGIYCWPPAQIGSTVSLACEKAFEETHPAYAPHLTGSAFRVCQRNGSWLWGNWTNYSECADSYEEYVRNDVSIIEEEKELVATTQYILFIGSILSVFCLSTAVSIFYYFKSLWCDRVTIHVHLMIALILRYVLLFFITEPFVLKRESNYRSVDFVCKAVLTLYLYATATSINWMFIQGVYINRKLTTNVFAGQTPFKTYYAVGWVLPILFLALYVIVMETRHPFKCWKGYSDLPEMWIVLGPMMVALLANFLFLINILRILLKKVHIRNYGGGAAMSDVVQFRRAAKATAVLIPLLGVNNLLFVYNPGGNLHKYYVIFNSLFGSIQGVFVAVVYCYMSKDVRDAFRRVYLRFKARRNARSRPRSSALYVRWRRDTSVTRSEGQVTLVPSTAPERVNLTSNETATCVRFTCLSHCSNYSIVSNNTTVICNVASEDNGGRHSSQETTKTLPRRLNDTVVVMSRFDETSQCSLVYLPTEQE